MSFENLRAAAELARLQRRIREAQLAECGGAEFRTLELGCEAKHAAARLSAEAAAVARDPMSNEAVRVSAREALRRAGGRASSAPSAPSVHAARRDHAGPSSPLRAT